MQKQLLLGVESISQGAIDGGMSGVYAYPGTPSTEILEYVQTSPVAIKSNLHRKWSSNEKTAYESALGMSYAGKRAMVCMKHVGLNVAADPFINSSITGVNGGLMLAVADDPSMHSSQNEQDSRFYGNFAQIAIFEPSSQQEAYDMAREGFSFSEKTGLPVMLRITTRLAHSRAGVILSERQDENKGSLPKDEHQFVLLPAIARKRYKLLLSKQSLLNELSENSKYNKYIPGKDKKLGIICSGIAYNYLMENFSDGECPYSILKISQYPVPEKQVRQMDDECDEVLVIEEGYPFVEEKVRGFMGRDKKIKGKFDGTLPRDGELSPDLVGKALGHSISTGMVVPDIVVNRPPALCTGCGHIDLYVAMNEVMASYEKGHVFADIGCYTLGALPPFCAINSCVDMGASITMAKGASEAGLFPAVAVIGDSTFTHSGMTGLLDAVNENSNITVVISDNESVSMTGGQDSSATGRVESICAGVGVDPKHIRVITPLKKNHPEMVKVFQEEIAYTGISVVISRRTCIQRAARMKKTRK